MKINTLLLSLLIFLSNVNSADLPSQGVTSPVSIQGPGGTPLDPAAPIGNGLLILLASSGVYILHKKRKKR